MDLRVVKTCLSKYTDFDHLSAKELARGTYGAVYAICLVHEKDEAKCPKVVKIITDGKEETLAKEITIAQLLQASGLTPHLERVFNCDRYLFIIMDRYDENMSARSAAAFQDHKVILRTLEGTDFPFSRHVYEESELLEMFRIAKGLSTEGVIHGDLKPDQFLRRKTDGKIVVTDFGFSGTGSGKDDIPAFRGWSWFGASGHFQPLPPPPPPPPPENTKNRRSSTSSSKKEKDKKVEYYGRYFNMYQLWTAIACNPSVSIAIVNRGSVYAYLDPIQYPFVYLKHKFYIPPSALEMFQRDENARPGGMNIPSAPRPVIIPAFRM